MFYSKELFSEDREGDLQRIQQYIQLLTFELLKNGIVPTWSYQKNAGRQQQQIKRPSEDIQKKQYQDLPTWAQQINNVNMIHTNLNFRCIIYHLESGSSHCLANYLLLCVTGTIILTIRTQESTADRLVPAFYHKVTGNPFIVNFYLLHWSDYNRTNWWSKSRLVVMSSPNWYHILHKKASLVYWN